MSNSLTKLDFAAGIKAAPINRNFNTVHEWIKRERKRIGGYGLVSGFDIKADNKTYTVTVGKGTFINTEGEEINVDEKVFSAGAPEPIQITEKITCPADGIIKLSKVPYSESEQGRLVYLPPTTGKYPLTSEFYVENIIDGMRVPILQVTGNRELYVNASSWSGLQLKITYYHAESRVDSILLNMDGTYSYQKSVQSISPSHVQIKDFDNDFLVGTVYWKVEDKVVPYIYINHRTYRKVYVDEENALWLNGKRYKDPQIIYLVEPEAPEDGDFWYNYEDNNIYIWRESNGVWGWVSANDHSTMTVRDTYMFIPGDENYPEDNQTFLFPEKRMDLSYVPGQNALDIIIDNAPLMRDQFEEITREDPSGKEYLAEGIGFKLVEPLDRMTHVEVNVTHQVKSRPLNETFQRAAIFVNENHFIYSDANKKKIFETDEEYTVGEDQLEVYLDGMRLVRDVDFVEMKDSSHDITTEEREKKKTISRYFRVITNINNGETVAYRISKHVWNYDQLSLLMHETWEDIKRIEQDEKSLENKQGILEKNVSTALKVMDNKLEQAIKDIPSSNDFRTVDEKINYDDLDDTVKSKFISDTNINFTMPTMSPVTLTDCKETDFIQVFIISPTINRILIKDVDYSLETAGNGVDIALIPSLKSASATLYVNGIKIGAR